MSVPLSCSMGFDVLHRFFVKYGVFLCIVLGTLFFSNPVAVCCFSRLFLYSDLFFW